jgi:hypothetical protein
LDKRKCLFPEGFLPGAVDGGDQDGAGVFIDGVMHQVGKLRHLGAADVLVPEGGKMRIFFDRGQGQLHLKRLGRRTICFNRSVDMLENCMKIYFWGTERAWG